MPPQEEDAFRRTLDAAQDYLALQAALAAALRDGFLALAQARYSMGADRVSALQLPATMQATARVRAAGGGELQLVHAEAAGSRGPSRSASTSSSGGAAAAAVPRPGAAGVGSQASLAAAGQDAAQGGAPSAADEAAAALQRLGLAAAEPPSSSIVDQLAAKYCSADGGGSSGGGDKPGSPGAGGGGGELDGEYEEEVTAPGRPLHWFGALVAPSLRDAEGHFVRALALALQAASAQRRLREGLDTAGRAAQQ